MARKVATRVADMQRVRAAAAESRGVAKRLLRITKLVAVTADGRDGG